ncbi:PSP1-domain-containing protein [Violaceomyces palustris]|uniref:PSP1-domain-containing protein n=1 Tax=Violaceomyces palustris TaxID=1673888 RepID=A0ACD0P2J9_9BASI|nr:PSP1-domain-containing protein [Violaceomyces palustris]
MGSATSGQPADLQELGKGVPLSSLPKDTPLYIVEFKQGRTDLFFRYQAPGVSKQALDREPIQKGDLVIVEADRGKDLGTVANDNINVEQVQSFLAHQSELAIITAGGKPEEATSSTGDSPTTETSSGAMSSSPTSASGTTTKPSRSINPKRLFSKATAADTSLLYSKAQDEERALQLCITKVNQRGLPMTVVAAEMQWDRRKLTFYYTASMRVDFRDLVKELFRLYKTRIWMCHLGHPSGTGMG